MQLLDAYFLYIIQKSKPYSVFLVLFFKNGEHLDTMYANHVT